MKKKQKVLSQLLLETMHRAVSYTHLGPLEKQSAKAKEYLKLRDEEKDIDIHLFLYDYERLKKEQEENRCV